MFHQLKKRNTAIVVPSLTALRINYRTHNGILAAAGEVVCMLQKLFPGSIDTMEKDRGYFPGSPPFVVETDVDLQQLLLGDNEERSQIEFVGKQR